MSDSFHISLSEFNKAEFDTADQLFSGLADKGIAKAQINIGMMFEKRKEVTQDFAKAAKSYRLAK